MGRLPCIEYSISTVYIYTKKYSSIGDNKEQLQIKFKLLYKIQCIIPYW
jgi:hypothetical protein